MKPLVLVAEDEAAIATLLRYNLEQAGYSVISASDGEEAMLLAVEHKPDVILLDWMMPILAGIEVCRLLRNKEETSKIPILMITARGEEAERVRGLDNGADDYITKPFSPAEVLARVKAVLRRVNPSTQAEILSIADLKMDTTTHKVTRGGTEVHLGPTEFKILRYFLQNPSKVFSREQLLDGVWGRDVYVEARTVDVHIRRLRKALNQGNKVDLIRTVRSAGYSLEGAEEN